MLRSLAAISLLGCSFDPVGANVETIAGGGAPPACGWAAVASIESSTSHCTATLIHPSVVVYAAHCGADMREVWFGPSMSSGLRVRLASCVVHPLFRPSATEVNLQHDIAACRLETPVDY